MKSLCGNVMQYIKEENNMETIMALTIRDIFLNDVIYIKRTNTWKEYNSTKKEWFEFNVCIFIQKLHHVNLFYKNDLTNYINNSKLQEVEIFYLLKQLNKLSEYIEPVYGQTDDRIINKDLFIKRCKDYFKIGL
jgi:hypothetical protein